MQRITKAFKLMKQNNRSVSERSNYIDHNSDWNGRICKWHHMPVSGRLSAFDRNDLTDRNNKPNILLIYCVMKEIINQSFFILTPVPLSQITTFLPWLSMADEGGFYPELFVNNSFEWRPGNTQFLIRSTKQEQM